MGADSCQPASERLWLCFMTVVGLNEVDSNGCSGEPSALAPGLLAYCCLGRSRLPAIEFVKLVTDMLPAPSGSFSLERLCWTSLSGVTLAPPSLLDISGLILPLTESTGRLRDTVSFGRPRCCGCNGSGNASRLYQSSWLTVSD